MSLALLALCLTCILPVQAQGPTGGDGPPADEGHYWKVTYASSGIASMHYLNGNQYNTPLATGNTWDPTANGGGIGGQYAVDATTSGTVTATMTWIPAAGKTLLTDPPSSPVHIIETASASWSATPAFSNSGQDPFSGSDASDGLGDPKVLIQCGQISSGTHLIQKDGLTGTIILDPVQMSANSTTCPTPIIWCYAGAGAYLTVSEDTSHQSRSVTISSSIDPTYHKDLATGAQVANTPSPIGTVTADSVNIRPQPAPDTFPRITYSGHPAGPWAADSLYQWYSAGTGNSAAGTFTMPGDPPYDFPLEYLASQTLTQEHINLKCTDASDGTIATANYYVNWHDELEEWNTVVDFKEYGAFVRVTPVYHPKAEDAKISYDVENSVKVSQKATGEGSLGDEAVGAKFGVELGAEYESATKVTVEYPMVPNEANWIERQAFWEHREGTVDYYDTHGYVGPLHWTILSAYHPGNPLIDYGEFQRSSTTDPPN